LDSVATRDHVELEAHFSVAKCLTLTLDGVVEMDSFPRTGHVRRVVLVLAQVLVSGVLVARVLLAVLPTGAGGLVPEQLLGLFQLCKDCLGAGSPLNLRLLPRILR
jgi:hypothetical protein